MSIEDSLPPDTTTHFIGAVSPRELHMMVNEKIIKPGEAWLLLEIGSLVHPKHGCYIGNEKLAERVGLSVRRLQVMMSRLTDIGLIRVLWYDGHRRHIETRWVRVQGKTKKSPRRSGTPGGDTDVQETSRREKEADVQETSRPTCRKRHVAYKRSIKGNLSDPQADTDGAGKEGFGVAKTKPSKATQFDTDAAHQLHTATKKFLGPSHPSVARSRPSVWATHFLRLRHLDEIPAARIQKVLDWYTTHLGQEFIPEAYSGETFRKKFLAIEKAMGRDAIGTVTVSPEAKKVTERLAMLGWPKGSIETVPQAVQVCLEGYRGWVTRFKATTGKLEAHKAPQYLRRLAEHVDRMLPAPDHFIQGWMTAVHGRVSGWDDWSGDFGPYLFKPTAKKFRNMGRAWAEAYNGDPDTWDRLLDVLQREGTL